MLTLGLLACFELVIVVLPAAGLPGAAVAGFLALLLWAMVALASVDLNGGFLTRLGFVFASAWCLASIGRWIPALEELYLGAGDLPGLVLSVSVMATAPLGMLMVSIAGPAGHAWRRFRRDKD